MGGFATLYLKITSNFQIEWHYLLNKPHNHPTTDTKTCDPNPPTTTLWDSDPNLPTTDHKTCGTVISPTAALPAAPP